MDADNLITITEQGMVIAEETYKRHKALTSFFISLGVDEQTAMNDACKVEHDLSKQTFEALQRFIANTK